MDNGIRPALETLSELDEGRFMDKLAIAIHDAVSATTVLNKSSRPRSRTSGSRSRRRPRRRS